MDLQPSGNSDEILLIETSDVYFILKGGESKIGFGSDKTIKVDFYGEEGSAFYNQYVYLKEYTDYEVIIESKEGKNIEFYHDNFNIRKKITPIRNGSKNLSGIINFKGDIGYTDIIIKVDEREVIKCTLEVYPSKISYKEDYKEILRDVNEEIYNLAYGFLSRTYLGAEINNRNNSSNTEFYSILNYVFDKIIKAIDVITINPHHQLVKETSVVKYHSLKSTTNETIKWLEKRPHLMREINGRLIPTEAIQTNKIITVDTKENRFLKFILVRINKKIDEFIVGYKNRTGNIDDEIINKLLKFKIKINVKLNSTFMKHIKNEYTEGNLSLVFTMASGYKEIYKYYLMLQKGLSINSSLFSLSMKELSVLYEYWCFIKINTILQKKYKLLTTDFLKINRDGIFVSLKKGITSTLKYENTKTKETFMVSYNSKKLSKTVAQKPDNVLSIYKSGNKKAYEFVFDAKYKIDYSDYYKGKYGGVGPKEEDINTMHRYRDAIVYNSKDKSNSNNCIFGAFVLFPYKDEEKFRNHRFYKSIDEVNIGAIPFLPSTTSIMEEFLDELINESSYSTYERALDSIGKEDYLKDDSFKKRNVLVGTLKSKEQLDINLRYNFYHTRKSNVNLSKNNVKYLALAQSKNLFGEDAGILYYGKVKDIKLVKRSDISALPSINDEPYYVFEVEKWLKLENKIRVEGYQVVRVLYTTEYLLKNAAIVTELAIKSKEEYRLWMELKRLDNDIKVRSSMDKENKIEAISIDGYDIFIKDEIIKVLKGEEVITIKRDEFLNKPRLILNKIMK